MEKELKSLHYSRPLSRDSKGMAKVLICTNHFYPETFRCNDVAFELANRGYDVTVLTAIPDYPKGKYYDGYGIFRKRHETVNGVKVIRGFIIPRGNGGGIRLMLNYLSFLISSIFISIFLGLFRKYDKVLIHETSPVMIGIPAVIVSKIQKLPLYFWVLDLWPESLQAAGGVNNKCVLNAFEKLTTWIYKNSKKILISSKGFEKSILEKGDFKDKIVYFPNWADKALAVNAGCKIPELPKGFIVMFAGNIGEAQDFDHIMEAANYLKDEQSIHFVFVGDGRKRPWVEKYRDEHELQNTVHWLGRHPVETMPLFFRQADVMLMTLKDVSIFSLTAPAKLQAYMSAGKPILAMMNGEGPRIIEEASCGFSVAASDSRALADTIVKLSKMPKDELLQLGQNGKSYQNTHFDLNKSIEHLIELLAYEDN